MGPTREQIVADAIDTLMGVAIQAEPISGAVFALAVALIRNGIEYGTPCESGQNGDKLCIPSRWSEEGWLYQAEHCRHCPVYIQHYTKETH